ncbi:acetyltransferase [Paenibacillus sp. FSL H7-0357]|uniref:GNAT family N-acetyltransferase n=1 Tax=unclassified Paenibacillus TaxID=185978 RepID=UPI0004F8166D|nr:GNAT family N-acetyltransferase [Paenibacillus sp. FSL H7-0357]AIQ18193.1 acetyltransferase [Paenibacillus sp. FSL H7-0357]
MNFKDFEIRKFRLSDIEQIVTLFYETVHSVNKKDYSEKQLDAWADNNDRETRQNAWKESLSSHLSYIVQLNDSIIGFADMSPEGYLDRVFTHKDFQGQGIASGLLKVLEAEARSLGLVQVTVDASITAKPFFEHHGYRSVQMQAVERKGVILHNFKMIKELD